MPSVILTSLYAMYTKVETSACPATKHLHNRRGAGWAATLKAAGRTRSADHPLTLSIVVTQEHRVAVRVMTASLVEC